MFGEAKAVLTGKGLTWSCRCPMLQTCTCLHKGPVLLVIVLLYGNRDVSLPAQPVQPRCHAFPASKARCVPSTHLQPLYPFLCLAAKPDDDEEVELQLQRVSEALMPEFRREAMGQLKDLLTDNPKVR